MWSMGNARVAVAEAGRPGRGWNAGAVVLGCALRYRCACLNAFDSRSRIAAWGWVSRSVATCGAWQVLVRREQGRREWPVLVRWGCGRQSGGLHSGLGGSQVPVGAAGCGLMQWVRAACARPASCMREYARSFSSRVGDAKTVVNISATTQKVESVCLSVCVCLSVHPV